MTTEAVKRRLAAVVERLCGPMPPPGSAEFERWFSQAADLAERAQERLDTDQSRNRTQEEFGRAAFKAINDAERALAGNSGGEADGASLMAFLEEEHRRQQVAD